MHPSGWSFHKRVRAVLEALRGPQLAILALAFALATAWFGPGALLLAIPIVLVLVLLVPQGRGGAAPPAVAPEGQMTEMEQMLDGRLRTARRDGRNVLCMTLIITGDGQPLDARSAMFARAVTTCLDRLSSVLRGEDTLFDLGAGRLGVVLAPVDGLDAAAATQLAARLRHAANAGLADIAEVEALTVTTGLRLETQPAARTARAMIADSLADATAAPADAV